MNHRLALVTGGGRGIGVGICEALAAEGLALAIHYRSSRTGAEAVADRCRQLGSPWVECFQCDLSLPTQRSSLIDQVIDRASRLDLVIHNAGISSPIRGDMLEVLPTNWDTVMETNLKGPFFLTQQAASAMMRLRDQGRLDRGMIIFVSSVSATIVSTNRSEYCVSKAGVAMMTQLWAHRLANEGVLVYEIRPGIIESDMTSQNREKYTKLISEGLTPIRRWGTPADVGRAIVTLARGDFAFSTGEVFHIDGGLHSRQL